MDETPPPRTTPGARAEESWQPMSRKCEPVGRSFNAEGGEELVRLDAGSSSRSPYRQSLSLWRVVSTGNVNREADPDAGVGAVVVVRGACLAVVCLEPMDPVRLTPVVARLLPVLKHLAGRRNLVSEASLSPDDRVIVTRTWMELVDTWSYSCASPDRQAPVRPCSARRRRRVPPRWPPSTTLTCFRRKSPSTRRCAPGWSSLGPRIPVGW